MSIVPDRAPGADAAVDVAVALRLLERFAADPPAEQPVMFVFADAHGIHMTGRWWKGATCSGDPTSRTWRSPHLSSSRTRNDQFASSVTSKSESTSPGGESEQHCRCFSLAAEGVQTPP